MARLPPSLTELEHNQSQAHSPVGRRHKCDRNFIVQALTSWWLILELRRRPIDDVCKDDPRIVHHYDPLTLLLRSNHLGNELGQIEDVILEQQEEAEEEGRAYTPAVNNVCSRRGTRAQDMIGISSNNISSTSDISDTHSASDLTSDSSSDCPV